MALTTAGTTSVAEHTLLLALAACRRLSFADSELRKGHWHYNSLRPYSIEIKEKSVGYIGIGRIAREVERRFRAFETTGFYFDPYTTLSPVEETKLRIQKASLNQLLSESDIVTIHAPLTEETRNLIGHEQLALMKQRPVLVNTARGEIIDEQALYEGLCAGRPSAAGLDVFSNEPILPSFSILKLPNVVLSPHISAGTWDSLEERMASALRNIAAFFNGQGVQNEVDLNG